MSKYFVTVSVTIALISGTTGGYSQQWAFGGNVGLSLLSGSPGLHMTPTVELLFNQNMGAGSEFSVNTRYGAPLLWHPYFKYRIDIRGSGLKPYASIGPVLALNVPNGPCFGFLFGAGVNIPVAHRLSVTPNVLLGPVFSVGGATLPFILRGYYWGYETYGMTTYKIPSTTILAFSIRGGIRYEM